MVRAEDHDGSRGSPQWFAQNTTMVRAEHFDGLLAPQKKPHTLMGQLVAQHARMVRADEDDGSRRMPGWFAQPTVVVHHVGAHGSPGISHRTRMVHAKRFADLQVRHKSQWFDCSQAAKEAGHT